MNQYTDLSGLYSLSKTLRFELKPIGKTLENIEKKGLLAQDETRAEEYKQMKQLIDEYHKAFISKSLCNFCLKQHSTEGYDSLEEYLAYASKQNRSDAEENALIKTKENLRKCIVSAFKNQADFADVFKKELIQKHLPQMYPGGSESELINHFRDFTSYFTGFHENRKNMYSEEEKSTAIAFRLIHENLPTFIDNMKSFEKIAASPVAEQFSQLEKDFEPYMNVKQIADVFKLGYFSMTLTQLQIEVYNGLIGGRTEGDVKIQGLNEYVNLYNQQHKDNRLPLLKPLYKMILSDKTSLSWLPEEFLSDEQMLAAVNEAVEQLKVVVDLKHVEGLPFLLQQISEYNTNGIYIANGVGLTDISQKIYGNYDRYTAAIKTEIRNNNLPKASEKRNPEEYDKRINNIFNKKPSFSISELNAYAEDQGAIENYFAQLGAFDRDGVQQINLFAKLQMALVAATDVLQGKHANLSQSEQDTKLLKDLLDAYKDIQHFIKPLLGDGTETEKDNVFDAGLRDFWNQLDIITPLYNKVRNWLTRKPYSVEKIKLNFENSQLLGGWDVNKEPDCGGILLRKDNNYYLVILDRTGKRVFDQDTFPCNGECYDKIDYKLLPGANKMLPKVFFSKSRIDEFAPSKDLLDAYEKGTHKKGKSFNINDCHRLIDFFKQSIAKHSDWSKFPFHFSDTSTYEDISGFYREVEAQGYMLSTRKVSESFINSLVDEGKIYLFQIWNKDFSEHSKGTPNMHTLYWKMLFDERNLADVVYKLNGQAEVFFRQKSLDIAKTTIHKANSPIKNKNVANEKKESTFDYDIIKNRRYTVDKFQFHVPITINFKAQGYDNINAQVQELIRNKGIEHIIGIDRGERHLLYLSLIDLKGNIVKQMTLNEIVNEYKNNTYRTNYKDLLEKREGDRTEARRNWQKIENIKEIKEGYLSQVVHVIAKMMVEYKAIVVLEDLNMGFMRGRQKIERSVYEQFEHMLIDKLNYLVDKKKDATEAGGLLHALQLASKFESFKKLGKQSGCLFYIPAWNTSKIDPVTGFVNMLDTRYENIEKAKLFFSRFDAIRYNAEKDWFEFDFDYNTFHKKAEGTRTQWRLCTYGERVRTFRNPEKLNQWDNQTVNLTSEFKQAFNDAAIDIYGNLKEAICMLSDKKHLERLMHLMSLLLQMRNSITNTEVDFMLSPVADENGEFFDSRKGKTGLPIDADANGAYNIARKGLWVLRTIQESGDDKPKLAITNKEWLVFAQDKPYLNN